MKLQTWRIITFVNFGRLQTQATNPTTIQKEQHSWPRTQNHGMDGQGFPFHPKLKKSLLSSKQKKKEKTDPKSRQKMCVTA